MDRLMSRVGLHGKSFIPLLSSYACAIPGIMATRTIDVAPRPHPDDPGRAADELLGPPAGLHVMITAFIPPTLLLGFHIGHYPIGVTLPALTMFAMYACWARSSPSASPRSSTGPCSRATRPRSCWRCRRTACRRLRTVVYQMFERSLGCS